MKKFWLIILLLSLISCSKNYSKEEKKQENNQHLLSEKELENFMLEMSLIEAVLTKNEQEGKDVSKLTYKYYSELFHKYKINSEILLKSIAHHTSNNKMEGIMERVVNRLTEMELQLSKGDTIK